MTTWAFNCEETVFLGYPNEDHFWSRPSLRQLVFPPVRKAEIVVPLFRPIPTELSRRPSSFFSANSVFLSKLFFAETFFPSASSGTLTWPLSQSFSLVLLGPRIDLATYAGRCATPCVLHVIRQPPPVRFCRAALTLRFYESSSCIRDGSSSSFFGHMALSPSPSPGTPLLSMSFFSVSAREEVLPLISVARRDLGSWIPVERLWNAPRELPSFVSLFKLGQLVPLASFDFFFQYMLASPACLSIAKMPLPWHRRVFTQIDLLLPFPFFLCPLRRSPTANPRRLWC